MVLWEGAGKGSWLYLEQEVNGVSGGEVEAVGTLPMVVDGEQWKVGEHAQERDQIRLGHAQSILEMSLGII